MFADTKTNFSVKYSAEHLIINHYAKPSITVKTAIFEICRKKPAKISFQLLCQMQCPCSKSLPTDSFFLIIASDSHAYAKKRIKFAINCKLIRFFNLKHIFFPASKNLFRFFFGFLIEFSVHLLHVAVKSTIKNGSIAIF